MVVGFQLFSQGELCSMDTILVSDLCRSGDAILSEKQSYFSRVFEPVAATSFTGDQLFLSHGLGGLIVKAVSQKRGW